MRNGQYLALNCEIQISVGNIFTLMSDINVLLHVMDLIVAIAEYFGETVDYHHALVKKHASMHPLGFHYRSIVFQLIVAMGY